MKIYFAGSIRGGRNYAKIYQQIIEHLSTYGEVFTEHVAHTDQKGEDLQDDFIYSRDINWIFNSDVIIAEVSNPSLGVGYELGLAVTKNKKILCLYQKENSNKISAMIAGCPNITTVSYKNIEDAKAIINNFLKK
jgi:2'-deoxynucleoside 5'-phosphate N-hydrolase